MLTAAGAYTEGKVGLPLGLAGATAATRFVGATASGAPVSGTFLTGDWIVDQTAKIWICTAGGSPGTWVSLSGGSGVSAAFSGTTTDGIYYVSKAGNDSTGDGTYGKPFLTVAVANAAFLASGAATCTIKLGRGRYTEEVWITKALNLIAESGVPGTGYYAATVIQAPSDSTNALNVIGSSADGTLIDGITTQLFSATSTGIGIRGASASQVKIRNWQHNNTGATPTKTQGGIAIAVGHGEKWQVNGYQISSAAQGIILGVEADEEHLITGQLSSNYQDVFAGPFETYRSALSGGVNSSVATFPIHNSNELKSSGLGFIDSEGIAWTGNAGNSLTGVARAVVAWLVNSATDVSTSLKLAPLSPGNYQTGTIPNPVFLSTLPTAPFTLLLNTEQITVGALTSNGDGTYTAATLTRGANSTVAASHGANTACQDVALTSAASHLSGAMVIQSYGTPGLAGAWGGGCTFDVYKATNCQTQGGSDYVEEWYSGGHTFTNKDSEEGPTNRIRFYSTSTGNKHTRTTIAQASTATDDGSFNEYDTPGGAGSLTFSSLSHHNKIANNTGLSVTDKGTVNDLSFGARRQQESVVPGTPIAYPPTSTQWEMARRPIGGRPVRGWLDDVFVPDTTNELALVDANIALCGNPAHALAPDGISSGSLPSLVPSPWGNGLNFIQLGTRSDSCVAMSMNGLLAEDEWTITLFFRLVGLQPPTGFAAAAPTGADGTFGATGTYYYRITATSSNGSETLASAQIAQTISDTTNHVVLTWSQVGNATGYKIYRYQVAGGELVGSNLLTTVGSGATLTFTDTGAATGAGNPPTTNTTASGINAFQPFVGGSQYFLYKAQGSGSTAQELEAYFQGQALVVNYQLIDMATGNTQTQKAQTNDFGHTVLGQGWDAMFPGDSQASGAVGPCIIQISFDQTDGLRVAFGPSFPQTWVSGQTYKSYTVGGSRTVGDIVFDAAAKNLYRNIATTGSSSSATAPSADSTNWVQVGSAANTIKHAGEAIPAANSAFRPWGGDPLENASGFFIPKGPPTAGVSWNGIQFALPVIGRYSANPNLYTLKSDSPAIHGPAAASGRSRYVSKPKLTIDPTVGPTGSGGPPAWPPYLSTTVNKAPNHTADGSEFPAPVGQPVSATTTLTGGPFSIGGTSLTVAAIPTLPAPTGLVGTAAASGGTFAAGTYYATVTATNSQGETIGSTEATGVVVVLNGTITWAWNSVPGATGYKLYRTTTPGTYPGSSKIATITVSASGTCGITRFLDTGAAASAGTVPGGNTAKAIFTGVTLGLNTTAGGASNGASYEQVNVLSVSGTTLTLQAGTPLAHAHSAAETVCVYVAPAYNAYNSQTGLGSNSGWNPAGQAVSDHTLDLLQQAGCPIVRFDTLDGLAPITQLNGASPPTVNTAPLTREIARWASRGMSMHLTIDQIPQALTTAGSGANQTPTNNTTYAQWAKIAVQAILDTYTASGINGAKLVSVSLINEPINQWPGASAPGTGAGSKTNSASVNAYTALWLAVQATLVTITGCPALGGPDDTPCSQYLTGWKVAINGTASAGANAIPIQSLSTLKNSPLGVNSGSGPSPVTNGASNATGALVASQSIIINPGGGNQETVTYSTGASSSSIPISGTLANTHSAGETVVIAYGILDICSQNAIIPGGVYYHGYGGNAAAEAEFVDWHKALLATYAGMSAVPIRATEGNPLHQNYMTRERGQSQSYASIQSQGSNNGDHYGLAPTDFRDYGLYCAAAWYRLLWDRQRRGVDMSTYFTLGDMQDTSSGTAPTEYPGLVDGLNSLPRGTAVLRAKQLIWKHNSPSGAASAAVQCQALPSVTPPSSKWPGLTAWATKFQDVAGKWHLVISAAHFRDVGGHPRRNGAYRKADWFEADIEWTQAAYNWLVALGGFTWRKYRVDEWTNNTGGLQVVKQDATANALATLMQESLEVGWNGVTELEIIQQ